MAQRLDPLGKLLIILLIVLVPVESSTILSQTLKCIRQHPSQCFDICSKHIDSKSQTQLVGRLSQQQKMEVPAILDYLKSLAAATRTCGQSLVRRFNNDYPKFKREWFESTYMQLMKQLGFDMGNAAEVRDALSNPEKYGLNYSAYKVFLEPL